MATQDIKIAACDSVFDVAVWMTAALLRMGNTYNQKCSASSIYPKPITESSHAGKNFSLYFVATSLGPVEPASWRVFENERPHIRPTPSLMRSNISSIVYGAIRITQYGLPGKMLMKHPPFQEAIAIGKRSEICFESMRAYYGRRLNRDDDSGAAPLLDSVMRPKVMRSHKGRAVSVTSWVPKKRRTSD